MKKLLYFAFFSIFAFFGCVTADTIDIKWGSDNQTYTTTTCTVGGDVILPTPPTKRGYVFRGWQKDVFNRGRWANWANVPSVSSEYPSDYHGNHVPEQNDYMVVTYASDYVPSEATPIIEITTVSTSGSGASVKVRVIATGQEFTYRFNEVNTDPVQIGDTDFYLVYGRVSFSWSIYSTKLMSVNGVSYAAGDLYSWRFESVVGFTADVYVPLEGTWRFGYYGTWSTDGKNGWKPVEQITNE